MSIRTTLRYLPLLLAALLFTQNTYAQKGELSTQTLKDRDDDKDVPNARATGEQTKRLAAWLKAPYLTVPADKATVGELSMAFKAWLKAHPEEMDAHKKDKDDDVAKYQRQLYRMEMDNDIDEVPISAHQRLDAFTNYQKTNPQDPTNNASNADGNWRLLGPVSNPVEMPYTELGYSDKSADNSGLGRINCIEFSIWDTRNLWVGTSTGGVWKSWDGGKNWANISMSLPIMEISDIAVDQSDNRIIYVAVGDRDGAGGWYGNGVGSRLYKTTDGGTTWFPVNANFGTGTFIKNLWVHPKRPWEIVVVKTNGIYKSIDGGATWTQTLVTNYAPPFAAPNDLYFESAAYAELTNPERIYSSYSKRYPDEHFAVQLRRSDDFGKTWQLMDSVKAVVNDPSFLYNYTKISVAPSDANCVYLVSTEFDTTFSADRLGAIMRTLDGGRTWENRSRYPSVPNTLGWVLGDSSDVGSQVPYTLVFTIDPKNKEKISTGGVDSWVSNDGGKSFGKSTFWLNAMGESAHADHHWGEYQPISGDYFLATDGGLYKTSNLMAGDNAKIEGCYSTDAYNYFNPNCYQFPTKWEFVGNGISNNEFYAIAVSKSNPKIIMGGTQDNGTLRYNDGKWTSVFGGDGFVSMIHPTNPNVFYSTVYYGLTWRTTDGGQNYQMVSRAMDTLDQGEWLTPMQMHEANPNIIIQARNFNLWRTTDGGNTWRRISNFRRGAQANQANSLAIAPSNPNIIYTARRIRDSATVPIVYFLYQTLDGGTTWKNIWSTSFPNAFMTDIAIHPTQPNRIWVTFNVGYSATNTNQTRKVFYSDNAGTTWTNITEGLPPVPVWSIVVQESSPIDAIYVATGVGVFYRDKTMNKFVEFQVGMPRGVMVTDLVIHEASGQIFAGTHGRGIWSANLADRAYDGLTALKAKTRTNLLDVYPNPAKDAVRIEWNSTVAEGQTVDILDLFGRVVFTQKDFMGKIAVDLSNQVAGVYTVQLKTGKEVVSKKFILTK
jgi:photosystem II stability/assembly factor-like uncharacterized protein